MAKTRTPTNDELIQLVASRANVSPMQVQTVLKTLLDLARESRGRAGKFAVKDSASRVVLERKETRDISVVFRSGPEGDPLVPKRPPAKPKARTHNEPQPGATRKK